MASCDWMKIKGAGEAKAMFRHCDETKRLECEHSNKDIDKTRTHLNMAFGAFDDGYESVCKAYDDFIADLDSVKGANKRKDRVTLVGWSIPVPKGMDEDMARDWAVELYRLMDDQYGDVLLGGSAHFDEVHEYKNAETGEDEESRVHVHMYAVPVVDGKLNAKQFMSRKNMVQVNNAIEAMTQARYPGYRFMDGTKRKSRKSVEELKNESDVREVVEQAEAQAAKIIASARCRADDMEAEAVLKIDETEKRSEQIIKDAEDEAARRRLEASRTRRAAMTVLSMAKSTLDDANAVLGDIRALEEAQASTEGSKLERALKFMESIRYRDGTTAKQRFESKELVYGHRSRPVRSRAELERAVNSLYEKVQKQNGNDGDGYEY